MLAVSPENKRRRKLSLERKAKDRSERRNPEARELRSPKFHQRIVDTTEKGGSRNLLRSLVYYEEDIINDTENSYLQ